MMLTLPCKIENQIISIPNEIFITERYLSLSANTHFTLELFTKKNMMDKFNIILVNGIPSSGYLEGSSFLKIKYIPCTLEQYKNMKAFL